MFIKISRIVGYTTWPTNIRKAIQSLHHRPHPVENERLTAYLRIDDHQRPDKKSPSSARYSPSMFLVKIHRQPEMVGGMG